MDRDGGDRIEDLGEREGLGRNVEGLKFRRSNLGFIGRFWRVIERFLKEVCCDGDCFEKVGGGLEG